MKSFIFKFLATTLFLVLYIALNQVFSQPNPGGPPTGDPLGGPIDGGVLLLAAAGIGYAAKKLYKSKHK